MTGEDSDDIANCYLNLGLCYSDKGLSEKGEFIEQSNVMRKHLQLKKRNMEKNISMSHHIT
jgi:hypothetical protein